MNLCLQTAPHFKLKENILLFYPKEPVTFQSFPVHFQTQTSTKDVSHDSTPKSFKYQNLSHSPSLNDNLDNTFDSTFSDFEMLSNPIYFSNSSDNSFPQIHPRIADSPFTSLTFSNYSQTVLFYTRARHSPYTSRSIIIPLDLTLASLLNIIFTPLLDLLIVPSLVFYSVWLVTM